MTRMIEQDRRLAVRTNMQVPVRISLEGSGSEKILGQTVTLDCSDQGARIYATLPELKIGSTVTLQPTGTSGGDVMGHVVWVTAPAPNRFAEAGVKFLQKSQLFYAYSAIELVVGSVSKLKSRPPVWAGARSSGPQFQPTLHFHLSVLAADTPR